MTVSETICADEHTDGGLKTPFVPIPLGQDCTLKQNDTEICRGDFHVVAGVNQPPLVNLMIHVM
jgi:hypothetical protein